MSNPQIFNSLDDPGLPAALKQGSVGVLPTDTVYGIVCLADSPESVARLYAAKHREGKPGTLIAGSVGQLVALGLKRRYLTSVDQYWPGPVSVIIPCGTELEYLHEGTQSLAVRIPADEALRSLLCDVGPLLTSSANMPGEPPATILPEAEAYFGDTIDFYVDGGDLSSRQPSTIIRIIDDEIEVLRNGAVKID